MKFFQGAAKPAALPMVVVAIMTITLTAAVLATATAETTERSEQQRAVYQLREVWRFTSNDSSPATTLTAARVGAVLPDGRLVVPEMNEGFYRVFDTAGRLLNVVGRKGEGPGEFDAILGAGVVGDTLYMVDWARSVEYELYDMQLKHLGKIAPVEGGSYGLVKGGLILTNELGSQRTSRIELSLLTTGGQRVRRFMVDSAPRTVAHHFRYQGQRDTIPSPVTAHWSAARLPDGSGAVIMSPGDLWTGEPGRVTMWRVTFPSGTVSAPLTLQLPPAPVPAAYKEEVFGRADTQLSGNLAVQYRNLVRFPNHFPAFRQLVVGIDNTLWLRSFADDTTYYALSPEGTTQGRLVAPADLVVFQFSMDYIWGRILDSDGVPIIVKYRVERR